MDSSRGNGVTLFLKGVLGFVGLHSITLGMGIYFFTDFFYHTFFSMAVENVFFVRQSGIFLFLIGVFYLFPLLDLKKYHLLITVVLISKLLAVIFLLTNAHHSPAPGMIYLATAGDAAMAIVLLFVYVRYWRRQAEAD